MKTTSLETSKLLKQAGFPQSTHFRWADLRIDEIADGKQLEICSHPEDIHNFSFAAPTAEEVLNELPLVLDKHCYLKVFRQDTPGNYNEKYWHIAYNENRHTCGKPSQMAWQFETSLAEAAAKMYLYLAEKGLLGK